MAKKLAKAVKPGDSFVDINEKDLFHECSRQSKLVRDFGLRLAKAKSDHATAKAELDLTKADLNVNIRAYPAKYGINKVTEGTIEAVIIMQKEHQDAVAAVIASKLRLDEVDAACNALEHRRPMLQEMVKMELLDYHSTTATNRGGTDRAEFVKPKKGGRG